MIGELQVGGQFSPYPSSPPRYVGVNGMRPLADSLLAQTSMVNVVRPSWISKLEPFNEMWHFVENGKPRGQFDIVIIAHNGEFLLYIRSSHDHLEKLPDKLAKSAISSFPAVIKTIMIHQEEEMKLKEKCEETRKEYWRKANSSILFYL